MAKTKGTYVSVSPLFLWTNWNIVRFWKEAEYADKKGLYARADCDGCQAGVLATLRISKDLLRNTLALQSFAYIDVTNGGVYNRLSADYALNDQLHATLGYDFFHADRGTFTIYDKNSEVFVKLKYSFWIW